MKIEILDELCGTGKTHAIIQWMKNNPLKRYLYVSPLLSEIEGRIFTECSELSFQYPENINGDSKSSHLFKLLQEGQNIAFTHALYSRLSKNHLRIIRDMNYTLIVDEEVSMIEPLVSGSNHGYSNSDLKYLYDDNKIKIDKDNHGCILWNWCDYGEGAKYSKLKAMCDLEMVYGVETDDGVNSLVIQLPMELINACSRVVLVSYLFDGSVMETFLKMKGVEIIPFDLKSEGLSLRYSSDQIKEKIKPLITFCETPSTKKIGRKRLTYTWYRSEMTDDDCKLLASAIRSVGRTADAKPADMMWTLPKDRVTGKRSNGKYVKPKGYNSSECFVHCSCRATNEYSHKTTLVHALYRHPNVTVEKYLNHHGFQVDIEAFALSEMIQWIWRSRIRNMEPITLSILSYRMRILFQEWLEAKCKTTE